MANAPTEPTTAEPTGLGEIIVTAQRRSEALQDEPVSVMALTATRIEQLQIRDFNSFVGNIPNLKVRFANFGPLHLNLAMRGVRSQGSLVKQDAAVGIYVNGLYFARSALVAASSQAQLLEIAACLPRGVHRRANALPFANVVSARISENMRSLVLQ